MDIKEVRANLNKKVRYESRHLSGEFTLNACIIRKNEHEIYCQAELQQGQNSVAIVRLENVQAINGEVQNG